MQLVDKNIILIIGTTRAGKGTLASALSGQTIKRFSRKVMKEKLGLNPKDLVQASSMAPVDKDGKPMNSDRISHFSKSHTFMPSLLAGPEFVTYPALNGHYLVDCPGFFDTKGLEVSIGVDLAIKKLIRASKSAKVVLLVPSTHLLSDNV
eukprot:CAMPEP_0116874800 /NCGR_PEP_ID=MMETSP0463-20121206/6391_1 /TAXON_ID=181622 /ORGANISM="Strombidinopsis sp, Strain SopsisLIS2011" /LENGTH=149 /DNA_ID=CAMNT_0004519065 /DNA_START=180 /DNA_END=629 /DNA_ORIENTATION=+